MENELNELNKVNEKSFAFVNVYSYIYDSKLMK